MYTTPQFLYAIFSGIFIGLIVGRMTGYSAGYRTALRKYHEMERKQRKDDKELSGRENIANRFANVVKKSNLAEHYEVKRSEHRWKISEFVDFVRKSDGRTIAQVEVNFFRQPDYHVIIWAREGNWNFGSDNKSLDDAINHLTVGLQNLAA
jgi:hypothetical protein